MKNLKTHPHKTRNLNSDLIPDDDEWFLHSLGQAAVEWTALSEFMASFFRNGVLGRNRWSLKEQQDWDRKPPIRLVEDLRKEISINLAGRGLENANRIVDSYEDLRIERNQLLHAAWGGKHHSQGELVEGPFVSGRDHRLTFIRKSSKEVRVFCENCADLVTRVVAFSWNPEFSSMEEVYEHTKSQFNTNTQRPINFIDTEEEQ